MPLAPTITSIASVKSKSAWVSLCDAMLIAPYGTVLKQPESNPIRMYRFRQVYLSHPCDFLLTRLSQIDGIPLRYSNGSSFAFRIPEIGEAPAAALD